MASGVATVAFDYGAAREHLRDGIDGAAIAVDDDADFIAAAVQHRPATTRCAGPWAANAHRAMQALHPEQVAADFDALLAGLADSRKAHASAAIA